jgi:hypothetical protein
MSSEVTLERDGRLARYRAVFIAHNWAKSKFEYFNEPLQEWRTVINWNSRERLFMHFTQKPI